MPAVDRPRGPGALERISALSALDDPVRRRLYEHVSAAAGGATREEAAAAVGIGRSLAAYHLDRLAAEGLVSVRRERRSGRTGPGAGRPANVYVRAEEELLASVPPRDYGFLARLLAEAVTQDRDGETRAALRRAAVRVGGELGRDADGPDRDRRREHLLRVLRERGYEPRLEDDGTIQLVNCPFHAAASEHPEVVCEMNASLLGGLLEGLGERDREAVLERCDGRCCVNISAGRGTA